MLSHYFSMSKNPSDVLKSGLKLTKLKDLTKIKKTLQTHGHSPNQLEELGVLQKRNRMDCRTHCQRRGSWVRYRVKRSSDLSWICMRLSWGAMMLTRWCCNKKPTSTRKGAIIAVFTLRSYIADINEPFRHFTCKLEGILASLRWQTWLEETQSLEPTSSHIRLFHS